MRTSVGGAKRLIAGAPTIRHRLPRLWARVQADQVWAWKALQIADKTRHLGGLTTWCVDRTITPHVESMAWSRFLELLDATLLREDEATYQRRADEAAAHRDVRSYRGEHGLRTLVAKVGAGDSHAFLALVERVAECLADDGDEDPVGVRRSKAFGIIAHRTGSGTCWPGTPTNPTIPATPTNASPRTKTIRRIRGPPTTYPRPAGKPTGTATTTNPGSTMSTT